MAALTTQRDTPERDSSFGQLNEQLAGSSLTFFKGQMVAISAAGLLVPATAAAGIIPCGRCEENVTTGAGNTRKVKFRSGVFKWANLGGDLVTQALVGRDCSVQDDQTVRATAAGSSIAGKVYELDADGVWVSQPFPLVIS